jgi:HEAT repeat protein
VEASLVDGDSQIRQKAAVTLGRMKSRPSIPKLRERLEDKDPDVRLSAACALWASKWAVHPSSRSGMC